ncbi:hypothetical protein M413DRAFT_444535 [Hebeloma cylindrosporum]|uniref:Jacalin-type lectin domain-containing protein n=1 Tax=Hebeloma cylindrosporum TaxID=76867 RepID=A0A0C3C1V6_HEBCY|nr:hypothetical protein M413DRAFT_444535 [Hebeloma cylindrosporum h7]
MTSPVRKDTYRLRSGDPNSPNAYLSRGANGSGLVVVEQLDASSASQKWDISPATDGDYTITAFGNETHVLRADSAGELVCSPTRRKVTWTLEPRGQNIYVVGNTGSALVVNLSQLGHVTAATRNNRTTQRWILDPDPSMPNVSNSLTVVWTGRRVGGGGGAAFDGSHSVAGARLREIRLWIDFCINGIQLVYDFQGQTFSTGCWGRPWGVGTQKSFSLRPGEFITKVEGRCGWYIDQLRFITNTGRQSDRFGGQGGIYFEWLPPSPTAGLGWFTGASASYVDSLIPHFIQQA